MPLKDLLSKSQNAIIIIDKVSTIDKACAVIGLYKTILTVERNVELLILKPVQSKIARLFEKNSVLYVTEIRPHAYEVIIDYKSSSIEKIIYDDLTDEKKLKFTITPGNGKFSFDSVEMKEGGTKFDLCILFDIANPKELRELYDTQEYLFREIPLVSVGENVAAKADDKVQVEEGGSYSEVVYNYIKTSKMKVNKEAVEVLLNGIVNHRKILEGNFSSNSLEVISSMVSDGANLSETIQDVYFSKSQENLNLQIKLMQNVKTDVDRKLIWSMVVKDDLETSGVTRSTLDVRGRIPFNISKDFDVAMAVYEVKENIFKVVVESNNTEKYSALGLASLYGGEGDEVHATCFIKYIKKQEIEKKLKEMLNGGISEEAITPEIEG